MRRSRMFLLATMLLGTMLLSGCLYVPGPGGVHGSVDYAVTPAGPCLFPGMGYEPYGHTVVPAPGSYRRYR